MIKILVVDDSKLARKRIIDTISKIDIQHEIVGEASDGIEGLEKFKELSPTLIITDIEMPNMSGMELVKAIREINLTLMIIVVSSLANEQVKQRLKGDPFSRFIKKPIKNNLLEMILIKVSHDLEKKEGEGA